MISVLQIYLQAEQIAPADMELVAAETEEEDAEEEVEEVDETCESVELQQIQGDQQV